mgnify:CR=1 FL=1
MNDDTIALQIAVSTMRDEIPADKSLTERVQFAMRYVRQNEHDLFWMVGKADDDLRLRTALAAVMVKCSEKDKDIIERSIKPLKMLSAAAQGIPVDFSAMEITDDLLPLIKLWHESEKS